VSAPDDRYSPGELAALLDISITGWVSEALASDLDRAKRLLELCEPAAQVAVLLGVRQQLINDLARPPLPGGS
jgi:hypothetical protein